MAEEKKCRRCGRTDAPLKAPPIPGAAGREIFENICASCWAEWQHAEVIVINELRLNFMDPRSQDILVQHMREFLHLAPPSGDLPRPAPPEER